MLSPISKNGALIVEAVDPEAMMRYCPSATSNRCARVLTEPRSSAIRETASKTVVPIHLPDKQCCKRLKNKISPFDQCGQPCRQDSRENRAKCQRNEKLTNTRE